MKTIYLILFSVVVLIFTHLAFGFYTAAIITALYLIIILLFKLKKDIAGELVVSIIFALFITTNYRYEYSGMNLYLWNINIYPLVLWSLGLVIIREMYEYFGNRFFLTSFLYIVILFTLEAIFFNFLDIRTMGGYPGIFGLDIIHGPPVIHYFYVLAGPIYLLVTKILKVK